MSDKRTPPKYTTIILAAAGALAALYFISQWIDKKITERFSIRTYEQQLEQYKSALAENDNLIDSLARNNSDLSSLISNLKITANIAVAHGPPYGTMSTFDKYKILLSLYNDAISFIRSVDKIISVDNYIELSDYLNTDDVDYLVRYGETTLFSILRTNLSRRIPSSRLFFNTDGINFIENHPLRDEYFEKFYHLVINYINNNSDGKFRSGMYLNSYLSSNSYWISSGRYSGSYYYKGHRDLHLKSSKVVRNTPATSRLFISKMFLQYHRKLLFGRDKMLLESTKNLYSYYLLRLYYDHDEQDYNQLNIEYILALRASGAEAPLNVLLDDSYMYDELLALQNYYKEDKSKSKQLEILVSKRDRFFKSYFSGAKTPSYFKVQK